MENRYPLLRALVWFVCLYHLFLGIMLNCPVDSIDWVASRVLGATKMPDVSALFLARMLGTYLIVFGIGMGLAAWNPVKNRALLSLGAILVVARATQRVFQANDLQQTLGISTGVNWATIVILVMIGVVLVLFRVKLYQDMRRGQAS